MSDAKRTSRFGSPPLLIVDSLENKENLKTPLYLKSVQEESEDEDLLHFESPLQENLLMKCKATIESLN